MVIGFKEFERMTEHLVNKRNANRYDRSEDQYLFVEGLLLKEDLPSDEAFVDNLEMRLEEVLLY